MCASYFSPLYAEVSRSNIEQLSQRRVPSCRHMCCRRPNRYQSPLIARPFEPNDRRVTAVRCVTVCRRAFVPGHHEASHLNGNCGYDYPLLNLYLPSHSTYNFNEYLNPDQQFFFPPIFFFSILSFPTHTLAVISILFTGSENANFHLLHGVW